jgi:xanthine dehydrogenase accessory factor
MDAVQALDDFFARHAAVVRVRVEEVQGSAPREAGATMLVADAAFHGTIGGGQLEYMAIDEARALIARGIDAGRMDVPLGPEIGQCCGGRVVLALDRLDAATRADLVPRPRPRGGAAAGADLRRGPCRARAGGGAPAAAAAAGADRQPRGRTGLAPASVETRLAAIPEAEVRSAPPGSAFVILTHDHALDFLLAAEALGRGDAAYVGMIGSASKRAAFGAWSRRQGGPSPDALVCPIGAAGRGDKRPAVIAAHAAAELLAVFAEPVAAGRPSRGSRPKTARPTT